MSIANFNLSSLPSFPSFNDSDYGSLLNNNVSTSSPMSTIPLKIKDPSGTEFELCSMKDIESYYESERWVLGFVAVLVISFGVVANVTSVRIFSHRVMISSSINWYLILLSISDTFILISAFFVLSLPRFGEHMGYWTANYISYSVTPYMYPLMMTAQTCSVYMTIGVSVHRYIGVCHPYRSMQWLPKNRVIGFIASLTCFSILFNSSRFFEVRVSKVCYRDDIKMLLPLVEMTELRINDTYMLVYNTWINMFIMYVIPFALLIALNSQVLIEVKLSRQRYMATQIGAEADEFSRRAERKERQTSIMLVSIVIIFIACNTLSFVCNILEIWGVGGPILQFTVLVNNFLVIVNASSNIFIYMLFSDKYRTLLQYYVFCNWSRKGELLIEKSQA